MSQALKWALTQKWAKLLNEPWLKNDRGSQMSRGSKMSQALKWALTQKWAKLLNEPWLKNKPGS